jgi:hypothetical protein
VDTAPGPRDGWPAGPHNPPPYIAQRQWGSASAAQTEEGIGEASGGVAVVSVARISRSTGRRTPATRRVTIGWMCSRSQWMVTGLYAGGSVRADKALGAEGMARSRRRLTMAGSPKRVALVDGPRSVGAEGVVRPRRW